MVRECGLWLRAWPEAGEWGHSHPPCAHAWTCGYTLKCHALHWAPQDPYPWRKQISAQLWTKSSWHRGNHGWSLSHPQGLEAAESAASSRQRDEEEKPLQSLRVEVSFLDSRRKRESSSFCLVQLWALRLWPFSGASECVLSHLWVSAMSIEACLPGKLQDFIQNAFIMRAKPGQSILIFIC